MNEDDDVPMNIAHCQSWVVKIPNEISSEEINEKLAHLGLKATLLLEAELDEN